MKKITLIIILSFNILNAQEVELPKVGDIAPNISLNNPNEEIAKNIDPTKFTFIEFWATWCGPCIGGMPKLNSFVEKYANNVNFLALTNESKDRVESFLALKPDIVIDAYIAYDNANTTNKAFGVRSIPKGFLIDQNQKVLWAGHIFNLEEAKFDSLLQNNQPKTKIFNDDFVTKGEKLFSVEFENVKSGKKYRTVADTYIKLNDELTRLLPYLIGTKDFFIFGDTNIIQKEYFLEIRSKYQIEPIKHNILNLVENLTGIKVVEENRILEFLEIEASNSLADYDSTVIENVGELSSYRTVNDTLQINNYTLNMTIPAFEFLLKMPVVIKDKMERTADWFVPTKLRKDELVAYLKKEYGITAKFLKKEFLTYTIVDNSK